jgi:hypothetical protein
VDSLNLSFEETAEILRRLAPGIESFGTLSTLSASFFRVLNNRSFDLWRFN